MNRLARDRIAFALLVGIGVAQFLIYYTGYGTIRVK